jgi:hypothetical protein
MSDETPTAESLEYTGICGSNHQRNATHKIAIHVTEHESRTCSKNFPAIESCSDIETTFQQCADIDVFPVFFDLSNVTAVQHGLTWPSEWYSCAYTKCAGDLTLGDIVNPGDGVAYSWFECQYEQTVVAGYGWLLAGAPGKICIAVNPATGAAGTSNCDFMEDFPLVMFCAGACGELGDDPCESTRTVPTTWGTIKAMFR